VRTDFPPPASLITTVLKGAQKQAPKNQLASLDVAVVDKIPVIAAELQYVVDQDGKSAMGAFKAAVFERADAVVICFHDQLGYRATFRHVAEQVARSLVVSDAKAPGKPVEVEIDLARIGKQPIGFSVRRHFVLADGTHSETDSGSMLVPRSQAEFSARDWTSSMRSDKAGAMTHIDSVEVEDAEEARNLHVERTAPGKYRAQGTVSGKEVKGDFASKTPIWSDWRERQDIVSKLLGKTKAKELAFSCYSGDSDPVGVTPCVWRATPEANVFDHTLGETHMHLTLDATGHVAKGSIPMGPAELLIERVVFEGATK
jgi:hypothetical protein